MYGDLHEILARPDIDAVLIATGDRWHTMASITAAKAGKDVYCEKPCSMTISESRALADTFRKYDCIYQAGTQRRSIGNFIFAADLIARGKLGKLVTVHANTLAPATSHQWLPEEPLPSKEECDWDAWLGPCPWRPYNKQYITGGWRGSSTSMAAASWNGALTRSTSANGPLRKTTRRPWSMSRKAAA